MADQLFEEWQVYAKLVIHDYMDHRAFFSALRREIRARFDHPVAILDLGCGDLAPMLPLLDALPVARYVGIDESEAALEIARGHLVTRRVDARLVRGDLLATLGEISGPFDVIVASFALHHLADPRDKQRTYAACRPLLGPDGFCAIIDVFCDETEPRTAYLDRWIAYADRHYATLEPEEKHLLFDHVRARDYPVSVATCRELAYSAGFERCEVVREDAAGLNRLVTLSGHHRQTIPRGACT